MRGEQRHRDDGRRGADAAKGRQFTAEGFAPAQVYGRVGADETGTRWFASIPFHLLGKNSAQVGGAREGRENM